MCTKERKQKYRFLQMQDENKQTNSKQRAYLYLGGGFINVPKKYRF